MKSKLTARELSNFCGQMGILLHSGISTTEGLHILCEESKTDTDREILKPLINSMEKNGSLSQALEDSGCFPKAMTAYIKTGEETGCLDEIMTSLSRHYDQEQEISQQIRSAVTYPLIMLGMMAVVILVLLVKVLPVFQQVFHQMGLECFEPFGAFYAFPCIKEFGMTSDEFALRFLQEEKVAVVPGTAFGACGEGFLRISYAYSLEELKKALGRLECFVNRLREEKAEKTNAEASEKSACK